MRLVIIGANGQLGSDLMSACGDWKPAGLTRSAVDVREAARLKAVLSEADPQIVINTAAFNQVDASEDDPEPAFAVNAYGARNVARVCAELGCALMHISTDYVFDGEKRSPYTEQDVPNPLSVYGVSKLSGEIFVQNICPQSFVVRTSGLYGKAGSVGKAGNFVDTMIRLAQRGGPIRVVDDQVLTPTYTRDLAAKLKDLAQTKAYGLYHITSGGQCSWYEFAGEIFKLAGLKPDLAPVTTQAFGAKARRPSYSVLASERLNGIGLAPVRPWREGLRDYMSDKGYAVS